MSEIRGYCRTNLDGYEGEVWPNTFAAVPRRGDSVQAASGKRLQVVAVTHYYDAGDDVPRIEVELHRG